jgi:hypothetical protein
MDTIITVLKDLEDGKYQRTMITGGKADESTENVSFLGCKF